LPKIRKLNILNTLLTKH